MRCVNKASLLLSVGLLVSVPGAAAAAPEVHAPDHHTTRVAAADSTAVLDWLTRLPDRPDNRVVSGFFGGYSGATFSLDQTEQLHAETGQYPGVLSCDYGTGWAKDPDPTKLIDYSCNTTLRDYRSAGGLITVNAHLPSPGPSDGGDLNVRLPNFADLLDPGTSTGARWRSYLDKVAAGLADLDDAGVPVLFRPLHEMNGDWFWWGNQDPANFRLVWQRMHDYLTRDKALGNLIWVYSPDFSRENRTAYYPGAEYTDIVGLDAYDDNPHLVAGYDEMVALGKPFAFTEIGPDTTGTFDYRKWITTIRDRFPRTVYFLAWNDSWAPHNNQYANEFMNDSWVVNRGEIPVS